MTNMIQNKTFSIIDEMLELKRQKNTNEEIALRLSLSLDTVNRFIRKYYSKDENNRYVDRKTNSEKSISIPCPSLDQNFLLTSEETLKETECG